MSATTPTTPDPGSIWVPRLTVVLGVLGTVAGIVVLTRPSDSLETLAVITGIFILVDGIVDIASAIARRAQDRSFAGLVGLLDLMIGALLIRHPLTGVVATALLIGLWLIAAGMLRVLVAIAYEEHRFRRLAAAAVLAFAGILIVASPHLGYKTLAIVTGIGFIGYGIATVLLGVALYAGRAQTQAA